MFALNICSGLRESGKWKGVAAALRDMGEIGAQIQELGLLVINPRPDDVLHEERVEHIYSQCAPLAPRAVVAALSGGSFDFLRFVPTGCLRIGMIQSDQEGFYQIVERYLPWLDAVAGVSLEICRKMEARLGDRCIPVFHQPYGVPMSSTRRLPSSTGPLRVLYIGRVIEDQKRISVMARIMKKTLASAANLEWTIAGDGPDLDMLRASFADDPHRVKFLGSVPYKDVPAIMDQHDVYFLCSDYEGLPLSLLEAMGAGLVPVVSDLPSGISEVVNHTNGIRVPTHDESAFVVALMGLASDRERLDRFSVNASAEVRVSHSTLAMAKRWELMMESLSGNSLPIWKQRCRATAPLEVQHLWVFHPIFRPFRAIGKRIRSRMRT